ncbi:hypothetical protein [Lysobacter sp. CA199]|uniref:hypothetical protein n=1 Tax=Lysobacter sp. CA199 TaxID=3455608 RepID=UPI003F8D1406
MNRRPDAPDPLSPEERDLAERLLRLGPHEGPSPALDARILAAAHAAVAQAPRARAKKQRWPAWIGVAASLSLAVGIAWQLRPMDKAAEAMSEEQVAIDAPAAAQAAAADPADAMIAEDSTVAAPALPVAPDMADSADAAASAAAPAIAEAPLPAAAPKEAPRAIAPPPPPLENARAQRSRLKAETATEAKTHQAPPEPAYSRSVERRDAKTFPAPAITPAAPASIAGLSAPADSAPAGAAAAQSAPAPVSTAAPLARDSAKPDAASAKSRNAATHPAPAYAPPDSTPAAQSQSASSNTAAEASPRGETNAFKAQAPPATEKEATTLDRVEITGSRLGSGEDERRLPAEQWLERIREYRDNGQTERARESLRQFRVAHPRSRIPKDLRPLLK